MKKVIFLIIFLMIILTILFIISSFNRSVTNTNSENITNTNNLKSTDINNVIMTIKEGTLTKTSATVIITDTNETPYSAYGVDYIIEKKKNNSWVELKPLSSFSEDSSYNENAVIMGENKVLEMSLDWSKRYGTLDNGKYRIVKNQQRTEEKTKKIIYDYFYVEFDIE